MFEDFAYILNDAKNKKTKELFGSLLSFLYICTQIVTCSLSKTSWE